MRIGPIAASALDQALLSLLNLAISFAFIKYAPKEDYGTYLLLMTPLYLITGIQNALLLSPIATVLPSTPDANKRTVYVTAVALQVAFITLCAIVSALGLAVYWHVVHGAVAIELVAGFAIAVAGVCAREGIRTLFYTTGHTIKALASDLVYGVGLVALFLTLCHYRALTPSSALMAMGVAALWPLAFKLSGLAQLRSDTQVLKRFWACGRWALIGVLVTWINLSAYPLIVGINLSTAAVADINVARLFLMPVGLFATAWANLYRPQISAWSASGQTSKVRSITLHSIAIGVGLLLAFTAALALVYPYVEMMLGPSYSGLLPLVLLWSAFFAFSLARGMLMATLMTAPAGYRQLQGVSWFALVISLSGLWFLSSKGVAWVVGVLIAVELVQLVLIGIKAVSWWVPKESKYA